MARTRTGKKKQVVSCPIGGCKYRGTPRGLKMHLRYHKESELQTLKERLEQEHARKEEQSDDAPLLTGANCVPHHGRSEADAPEAKEEKPQPVPETAAQAEPVPTRQRNLEVAFHSECVDLCTYRSYEEQARKEGMHGLARLFRMARTVEEVHVRRIINAVTGSRTSAENLAQALQSEIEDVETVLPGFLEEAESQGFTQLARIFRQAIPAETVLRDMFRKAKRAVDSGRDVPVRSYFVCTCCGTPHEGLPPTTCPVCGVGYERIPPV